jgi:ADP-dependent NAD(P)H-hydrate dehydratase / NAD(P)H-hydrate epimerase
MDTGVSREPHTSKKCVGLFFAGRYIGSMKLVSARQMQELDRQTIQLDRVSQKLLMRRAGQAVAEAARAMLSKRGRVLVLAGPGNNGGDALIAANLLKRSGYRVEILQLSSRKSTATFQFQDADLVIDGLLGTGLSRPVKTEFKAAIEALNRARAKTPCLKVLAVDIPSGLNADTGKPMGAAVMADVTVTFGLPKLGLVQQSAADFVGRLQIADIGFSAGRIARIKTAAEVLTRADIRPLVRVRRAGSYKTDFGHVLVVAGSEGLHGAAWITAHGALAAGAGLVTLAVPRAIYSLVASQCRQVMVAPIDDGGFGYFGELSWRSLEPLLAKKTVLAIGPGLGRERHTLPFLEKLLGAARMPLVLDADALTLLAGKLKILRNLKAPAVLTPHPGEMARLLGATSRHVQQDRLKTAAGFASKHHVVLVLKGARTVIAEPSGPVWVNVTGNAGLASGGSGDVLTGVIAGLAGQRLTPADAAKLGVFVHGLAADQIAAEPVVTGIKVEKLLEAIPGALRFCRQSPKPSEDTRRTP